MGTQEDEDTFEQIKNSDNANVIQIAWDDEKVSYNLGKTPINLISLFDVLLNVQHQILIECIDLTEEKFK